MAVYTLGQGAYVNKGTYNSGTAYAPLNTVFYFGGTWVALTNVTGVAPGSDATKWLCITKGIKTSTITENNGSAVVTITFTDGSTATANISLATVGDGTFTVDKLASGFVLPVGKGGTGGTAGAQAPIQVFTGQLSAASWNSSTRKQDVSISGMTANSKFIAMPSDKAGWIAAQGATIYPPTAGAGKLTFECDSIPSENINITVYWW